MSNNFVGRKVQVKTLDYCVEGIVETIENGRLILENAISQGTGERLAKMIVEGSQITDIQIMNNSSRKARKQAEQPHLANSEIEEARKEFDFAKNLEKFDKTAEHQRMAALSTSYSEQNTFKNEKIPNNEMVITPHETNEHRSTPRNSTKSPSPAALSLDTVDGRHIPIATAMQMAQIVLQMEKMHYNSAAVAETAAQGIVDIIDESSPKTIVFLVGTHNVGHWAVAAARKLAGRGFNVVVVSPNTNASQDLSSQSRSFTAIGGHLVTTQKALFAALDGARPDVVVDALEGYESPLVDQLDENELAAAEWLIQWCQKATRRLSLCTASITSTSIIALGFPLADTCSYLVDIGIPIKALRNLRLNRFVGNHFSGKSYICCEYQRA